MPSSYVCDTIPAARLASASSGDQPPPRKLCVRHQRMADEGTNLKLQHSLDALPVGEREQVNAIWSAFSSSSHPRRALILQGLLTMCCFSQLSLLTEHLVHLIRIDPFTVLPREIGLKVLMYLDATSLCRAAQVSRRWRALADDDILWRGICEQHIGQKCTKCGWGLPILEKKRVVRLPSPTPTPCPVPPSSSSPSQSSPQPSSSALLMYPPSGPLPKRQLEDPTDFLTPPLKRQRSDETSPNLNPCSLIAPFTSLLTSSSTSMSADDSASCSVTRPWKDVYSERMTIERNWRRGRCTVKTLKGHTDGVMCLQFSETLQHPAFPVLITGSYDRTVRVWNMETGTELHCLKGHTRAVRALQFDEVKLITGSMDNTIKVWDWRGGKCIRTLTGHTEGVVCLNYDSNVLASGSVDATIKVWNLRTGGAFTLRGHSDWVNSVQLWDSNPTSGGSGISGGPATLLDCPTVAGSNQPCSLQIDPGKMLFSASDDGTIRLWDLTQRTCVRQFTGHVGQVQSMKLLVDECDGSGEDENSLASSSSSSLSLSTSDVDPVKRKKPLLISGSLDNTIKMWDIETGNTVRTFFGHIEGVWAVASDKLRLVSGSHDRTIKVWSREEGKCTTTLVGHQAAVSCLALGEDKIVSGSDDNDIKIWSFGG
ncbi:WD40 repeat-like protein [Macrolepiota fuliginosa MF-IS2]|uniref:WD40 repeat-like protein n=1 Tax=Macrolepiota fuliginosa MF-IS2 TaxID=1400762 RepID=A0A9P5XGX9_9AGAR|nr:WD40 repeat-like protein [Macrolepiota fuliginosa MF-IS2]